MHHQIDMIKKMDAKGLKVKVSFDLPFCLYVKDDSYEVQMYSYTATVSTKRKKQKHIDPRLGIEEATTELKHDRHGRLRYTGVEVMLPRQAVIERETKRRIREGEMEAEGPTIEVFLDTNQLISEYSQPALEEGMAVANYFIAAYREVTRDFYIKTFSKDEIYRATINWFDGSEFLGGVEHGSFGKGMTLEPVGLLPETDQKFRQRLKVYSLTPLYTEVAMNARDYLDLGNYRMAVIESRTCVEVVIDQLLQAHFTERGTSVEKVKRLLNVRRKDIQTIEDALEKAWINNKLTKGLKHVLGKSLDENVDLWERWLKAKSNRERAVHRAVDVSEADAKDAIETLSQIFDFIIK